MNMVVEYISYLINMYFADIVDIIYVKWMDIQYHHNMITIFHHPTRVTFQRYDHAQIQQQHLKSSVKKVVFYLQGIQPSGILQP